MILLIADVLLYKCYTNARCALFGVQNFGVWVEGFGTLETACDVAFELRALLLAFQGAQGQGWFKCGTPNFRNPECPALTVVVS